MERVVLHPSSTVKLSRKRGIKYLNCIGNLVSFCIAEIILKNELNLIFEPPHPQSSLFIVHQFQYFVVLGRSHHSCQIHWYPLWILTCHLISISFLHLIFDKSRYPRKGSFVRLLGVICVEFLVGYNNTNIIFIEICNGCL